MELMKRALLTLALIYLMLLKNECEAYKNKIVSVRPYPDKSDPGMKAVYEGIENTTTWFVYCNDYTVVTDANCSLYVQDYEFNNTSKLQKCDFLILPTLNGSLSMVLWLRAFRLSEDKFLITWIEYSHNSTILVHHVNNQMIRVGTFVNFLIIHMDECKIRNFRTTGSTYNHTHHDYYGLLEHLDIRINEHSVDVFYPYFGNSEFAQERFDSEGRMIKGPVGVQDFELDDRAVKVNMYYNHTKQDIRSWERFNAKDVCYYNMPCHVPLETEEGYGLTTSRNTRTSCRKTSSRTWACQSESLLNPTSAKFTMAFDYEPKHLMIYNIWVDPQVVMTSKAEPDGGLTIYLTVFGFDNSPYKPVAFATINGPLLLLHGHFFLNDDYDICFSMLWTLQDYESFFNFVSKCFPKDHLTVKP